MKFLLTVIFFFAFQLCPAQNNSDEKEIPCIAYWKKGEQKTYLISRKKEKISGGRSSVTENFLIETKMNILDSTAEGYTISWEYGIPPELEKNTMMYKVVEIMARMKFLYKTDNVGIFTELVNWEEIRDFYIGMLKLQLEGRKMDEKGQKVLDELLARFQKREVIESTSIREIQLFHAPFGLMFSTKDTSVNLEVSLPIFSEQMPAVHSWGIAEIGEDNDNFKLQITQNIDSAGALKLIESIIKKYDSEQEVEIEELRKQLATFDFVDVAEYKFVQSTGWINEYTCIRKVTAGNQIQVESYKMELRER